MSSEPIRHPSAKALFDELQHAGVGPVVWKNAHEIETGLAGKDDLDLFVPEASIETFDFVLARNGYITLRSPYDIPYVKHCYGLMPGSDRLTHLHIYKRIHTGESHTKNFHLPIENELQFRSAPSRHAPGLSLADPILLKELFLVRYFIKHASFSGAALLKRSAASTEREWEDIESKCSTKNESNTPILVEQETLDRLMKVFEGDSYWDKIRTGRWLVRKLGGLRRLSVPANLILRYWHLIHRLFNRFLGDTRKQIPNQGFILAIVGTDGAGKTTIADKLTGFFGKSIRTRRFHVGRPPATVLTYVYRLLLNVRRRSLRPRSLSTNAASTADIRPSFLRSMHHIVTAYERFVVSRRAADFAARGGLAVCDRWILDGIGIDGAKLAPHSDAPWWVNSLYRLEHAFYAAAGQADLALHLKVPLDVAIKRNRLRAKSDKESDDEIARRYVESSRLHYKANMSVDVDASSALPTTLEKAKARVWEEISIRAAIRGEAF